MRKLVRLLSTIIALSLAVHSVHADESQKLRVAVILPLTGEAASWGQAFKNGMTLGIEALSEKAKSRIEFVFEDDSLSATRSVSALNKLLVEGRVDGVINLSSGTAKALAPIVEAKHIPMLAIATDPAVGKGRKYAFNFWVTPEEEIRLMIPEIEKRGYKRVARIGTIQEGVLALHRLFDQENNNRINIVLSEDYPPDIKDFKTFITKLKKSNTPPDSVMVALLPGQLSTFSRQLRELNAKVDIFGWETLEDLNEVKLSQGTLVGAWYISADDGNVAFLKNYKERFPGASSFGSASGYDGALLFGAVVDRNIDRSKIAEFFGTLKDFQGALGTYSATGDQRFTLPAAVKVVTKDGFEKVALNN